MKPLTGCIACLLALFVHGAVAAQTQSKDAATPLHSYTDSVAQAIRSRTLYQLGPDHVGENPTCQVDVTTDGNGMVVNAAITKSSGLPGWDAAVLKAVWAASPLPLDPARGMHSPRQIVLIDSYIPRP